MGEIWTLGEGQRVSTACAETGLNNNILVVGPSGSGKTMSYAEMCLVKTENASLIVTLSKRRLVKRYAPYLAGKGFRVYDLNLAEPGESGIAYDPLRYLRSDRDVTYLAQAIVMADPRKEGNRAADPFWDDAAISLLSALIAYVRHVKSRPSFDDVCALFARLRVTEEGESIRTNLDDLFDRLNAEEPEGFAYQCWKTFRYAPMRTAGSIYSSLSVTMDTIFSPELRRAMREKAWVDFPALTAEKTVLFVTTSAVNPSLNAFAGLFYSQAVKELFEYAESREDGVLPRPLHLLCDDFAVGARVPSFAQYISVFREKGMSVSILLQSESQLRSMYGDADAVTIINNCDRYLYLGGMDLATCRSVAERMSLPLPEVLYMPLGREFLFQRGRRPVVTERFHITEDPEWRRAAGLTE